MKNNAIQISNLKLGQKKASKVCLQHIKAYEKYAFQIW